VLLKNHTENKITINFYQFSIDPDTFFEEVNPHALFFLADTEKCKELEDDYGMMFISNENQKERAEFLFNDDLVNVSKNDKENKITSWDFISKYKHPCNSLIIADNYILQYNEKIENNLIGLLRKVLPDKLNKREFQITIITGEVGVKQRYDFIMECLDKLKKPYKISLKIITKSVDNHDRNFLTNYLWINSGYGFTIFRDDKDHQRLKPEANTHLSITPLNSNPAAKDVVLSLKNQYKKIEQNGVNIGSQLIVMPKEEQGKVTSKLLK
jgi:hypothetical protein